ncbi:aarF domain-containing protein kinase 1 isoform X3 [Cucumis sativus]|uniref:aarF domain-containing protein kinase 1 isoform X3 n=1 Tax=Cucumis sativus TaxID=3659 RepID=UPI0012F4B18A|nr:aarF domain-containing protein kinase 1 isoform X3 [Cucumis sativus]
MKIFSFRRVATLCVLTTGTGLAFKASNSNSNSLDVEEKFRTTIHGFRRSSRAISTISLIVLDYKYSLNGEVANTEEYRLKLSEVHLRSAKRLLKLCQVNKGFYIKAGQFAASLRQTPNEYSSILSSLQDQAVPCPFKDIKDMLISNLGSDISAMFLSLDEQPIAAASIAQVHRAILKSNKEVAIKVQYPGLMQNVKIDTTVMSFLSRTISWLFPEYRFEWLASEFGKTILLELDFLQEARNAERTAENFKKNNLVKIPRVYWEFTTRQVLTMEFCEGHKVDDIEFMKQSGIEPSKVAKALVEVFAEMVFVHGFLHGDPHPGNILVSPDNLNGFTLDPIVKVAYFSLKTSLSYLHLRLILAGIEALSSFQKFMYFTYSLCRRYFHAMKSMQMLSFP